MKSYITPKIQIVHLNERDLIVTSFTGIDGETDEWDARVRRNPIWDDYE